jgi:hypothetical protein
MRVPIGIHIKKIDVFDLHFDIKFASAPNDNPSASKDAWHMRLTILEIIGYV